MTKSLDSDDIINAIPIDIDKMVPGIDIALDAARLVNPIPIDQNDPSALGVRGFTNKNGKVIYAIVIAELSDSFIVLAPAILLSDGVMVKGEPISKSYVIRLFKSTSAFMTIPDNILQHHYLKYVRELPIQVQGFLGDKIPVIDALLSKPIEPISNTLQKYAGNPQPAIPPVSEEDELGHYEHTQYGFISKTRH